MSARHVAAEVVVDIGEGLILKSITSMLEDVQKPREPSTIFKVSDEIRNEDPGAYKPQIVSIGPFHRGDPQLHTTERIKRHFLLNLISRHRSNTLDKYIKAVSPPSFVANVSRRYSEQVVRADGGNTFVETMVLDGCFVIEYLVKLFLKEPMGELDFVIGGFSRVRSDLLLIENQMPFCVLQVLFDSSSIPGLHYDDKPVTFKDLAASILSFNMSNKSVPIPGDVHHLLHLLHHYIRPTPPEDLQSRSETCQIMTTIRHTIFQCVFRVLSLLLTFRLPPKDLIEDRWDLRPIVNASELYQAGITFQCKTLATCMLDVTFSDSDGVMEIPLLSVSPNTVPMLRNLVAFEHNLPVLGYQFSTYMGFMNCLIDTSADLELLVKNGVLDNNLGSSEEAARFFNSVGKLAYRNHENYYMEKLFKRVKKYSAIDSHRWRAKMMHDYFSNPWTTTSLLAAILLLLLTLLQTFFAVFAYVRPP